MRRIPKGMRKRIAKNPWMKTCIHQRIGRMGDGPVTWEHAFVYGGRQINEEWAIVPCRRSFNVGVEARDKLYNQWVAINRISLEYLEDKYPKRDWVLEKSRLDKMFSHYSIGKILNGDLIFQK